MNIQKYTDDFALLLRDESKRTGFADYVCFPKDTAEVAEAMHFCAEHEIPVTVQGSRTGVGGGAVPEGGLVMSLERLKELKIEVDNQNNEKYFGADSSEIEAGGSKAEQQALPPKIIAGAGVRLLEIDDKLRIETGGRFFLPPDPTERSASAGGAAACNSSGARTYGYGPMRSYIEGLTVVLADGSIIKIKRGDFVSSEGYIELPAAAQTDKNGKNLQRRIKLPSYRMPEVKCAAGFYIKDRTDLVDLFIGAEGTLGIITEVEFRTEKSPAHIWGLIAFFEEVRGLKYAESLRKSFPKQCPERGVISIEYFDKGSLKLLKTKGINLPKEAEEAVFSEILGESRVEAVEVIRKLEAEILKAGGNPDTAWAASSSRSFASFKELRHKTPEAVNERVAEMKLIEPTITKLGSDMALPEEAFADAVKMYKHDLEVAGLDFVIFGHIGNCHLHCNIMARNADEYTAGKAIFSKWADFVGKNGGSISAEHGVGKLKRDFLLKMYGETAVGEMRELKRAFDPNNLLGRGNIFE